MASDKVRTAVERLVKSCRTVVRQWESGHSPGHDAIMELHRALKATTPELKRTYLEDEMVDKFEGVLEVGHNENGEIVINHPDLHPDENGVGHIIFSPAQARNFALLLWERIGIVESEIQRKKEEIRIKSVPTVDRTARVLTDGSPVTDDHREIQPSGQQKDYVVLSAEERSKGFVRPVRRSYRHKICNTVTGMGIALAETYARDPGFYSATFCVKCKAHFPLDQFVWEGTKEQLGS